MRVEIDTEGPAPDAVATDAQVVSQSLGDPRAFGRLFERHGAAIYRFVLTRLGPDAADDVVSETFLTAFDRRARFDVTATTARPWLYGIAANLVHKHRRAERRWLERCASSAPDLDGERFEDSADERVDVVRRRTALAQALLGLSSRERDVLMLAAVEGWTAHEIAAALGISENTAKVRLSRARANARNLLGLFEGDSRHDD